MKDKLEDKIDTPEKSHSSIRDKNLPLAIGLCFHSVKEF